jgi:hypothetical protein
MHHEPATENERPIDKDSKALTAQLLPVASANADGFTSGRDAHRIRPQVKDSGWTRRDGKEVGPAPAQRPS